MPHPAKLIEYITNAPVWQGPEVGAVGKAGWIPVMELSWGIMLPSGIGRAGMRFANTRAGSFYGDVFREKLIPADALYRKLSKVLPWERFAGRLLPFYERGAEVGVRRTTRWRC
jgi:hypothetical protein